MSNVSLKERFEIGQRVRVDWSEGMGPLEEFTGTVVDVDEGGYEPIITVSCDEGTYPERSIYGPKHDCAPEWVTHLEE